MTSWLPIILMLSALFLLLLTVFLFLYYGSNAVITVFFMMAIFFGLISCGIFIYERSPNKFFTKPTPYDIKNEYIEYIDENGNIVEENEIDYFINHYC